MVGWGLTALLTEFRSYCAFKVSGSRNYTQSESESERSEQQTWQERARFFPGVKIKQNRRTIIYNKDYRIWIQQLYKNQPNMLFFFAK